MPRPLGDAAGPLAVLTLGGQHLVTLNAEILASWTCSRKRWKGSSGRAFAKTLDIEPSSVEEMSSWLVDTAMGRGKAPRLDELPPKIVLKALYEVAHRNGVAGERVDLQMVDFLREVLDTIFSDNDLPGRLQVRGNDTWWRLLRYLRECEDDTHWGARRRGFWVKNAGGRGKVALWPAHPSMLKITIAKDWL